MLPYQISRAGAALAAGLLIVQTLAYGQYEAVAEGIAQAAAQAGAENQFSRLLSVNHLQTLLFGVYLVLNGIVTLLAVHLVYRQALWTGGAAVLLGAGLLVYGLTNYAGRALHYLSLQKISLDVANFLASPLVTIFLLSAFTLTKFSKAEPNEVSP